MSLSHDLAALVQRSSDLEREVELLRAREAEIGRKLYRRGYLAGRSAARRGAPYESAPDRHARGWAREVMR